MKVMPPCSPMKVMKVFPFSDDEETLILGQSPRPVLRRGKAHSNLDAVACSTPSRSPKSPKGKFGVGSPSKSPGKLGVRSPSKSSSPSKSVTASPKSQKSNVRGMASRKVKKIVMKVQSKFKGSLGRSTVMRTCGMRKPASSSSSSSSPAKLVKLSRADQKEKDWKFMMTMGEIGSEYDDLKGYNASFRCSAPWTWRELLILMGRDE